MYARASRASNGLLMEGGWKASLETPGHKLLRGLECCYDRSCGINVDVATDRDWVKLSRIEGVSMYVFQMCLVLFKDFCLRQNHMMHPHFT